MKHCFEKKSNTRIAILTDLHYSTVPNHEIPDRHGEYADILLIRALRWIREGNLADAVVIAGDVIDNEKQSPSLLENIAKLLKDYPLPVLTIPGNHDLAPEIFHRYIPRQDFLDVNDIRIIPFEDPETSGYNAVRTAAGMADMCKAREHFSGKLVFVQHTPLYPPECDLLFKYQNDAEITTLMEELNVSLSISGHLHCGSPRFDKNGVTYLCVPALCESPFQFAVAEISRDGSIDYRIEQLRLPDGIHFFDMHTHSPFTYCNQNMDPLKEIELMKLLNLGK